MKYKYDSNLSEQSEDHVNDVIFSLESGGEVEKRYAECKECISVSKVLDDFIGSLESDDINKSVQ